MKSTSINSILIDAVCSLAKQLEDDDHDMNMSKDGEEYDMYQESVDEDLTTMIILSSMVLAQREPIRINKQTND